MKRHWLAVAIVCGYSLGTTVCAQVTRYVDNNSGDGNNPPPKSVVFQTIQEAIDLSVDGDTVKVYPGTYTSTASEVVNLRGKAIVLEAAVPMVVGNYATYATIYGQEARRGIVATENETDATVVRGLRVFSCRVNLGAAMIVMNGSPRIEGMYFEGNFATDSGGALLLIGSASVIQDCLFQSNTAIGKGGAILNSQGSILVDSCEFADCTAARGGSIFTQDDASTVLNTVFRNALRSGCCLAQTFGLGVYAKDSHIAISASLFKDLRISDCCGTGHFGAGIVVHGADADVLVSGCQFLNNRIEGGGGGRGGAIAVGTDADARGSVRVVNSEFQDNYASADGGAIAMQSGDRLEIDGVGGAQTLFKSNSCGRLGGAISVNVDWNHQGTFLLDDGVFVENSAIGNGTGGAVWIRQSNGGLRVLTDSVFVRNGAAEGGALYLEGTNSLSQIGSTVYCGNFLSTIRGSYLDLTNNCFTVDCSDANGDAFPDSCEPELVDCNGNTIPDQEELIGNDINNDQIPDDCQIGELDFDGLESELVTMDMTRIPNESPLPITALCWRVYAKTRHPDASVICVFGNAAHSMSVSASGGFYQHGQGGDTVESILCGPTGVLRYDSFFTIEANCAPEFDLLDQNLESAFSGFNCCGNYFTNNGAYFVMPGAAGSQAGSDQRILLMQVTTMSAIKPSASINLLGRHHLQNPDSSWSEWNAFGLAIPDPIMVDCNGNGIHDSIEIATGQVADSDRNGLPDNCQQCLGDVDSNGAVDVDDLIEILVAWGDPNPGAADLDGNGVVNAADLIQVLDGWGACIQRP